MELLNLNDYVDTEKLREMIDKEASRTLLRQWTATALEAAAPARYKEILRSSQAHNECSEQELTTDHLVGFFRDLLCKLGDESARRAFLTAEAINVMKWDRWKRP